MSSSNPGPAVTTGSNSLGGGSPVVVGAASTSLVGFWGATPVAQRTSSAQTALASVTATAGGYSFTTSTAFTAFIAQINEIQATLVQYGMWKGS